MTARYWSAWPHRVESDQQSQWCSERSDDEQHDDHAHGHPGPIDLKAYRIFGISRPETSSARIFGNLGHDGHLSATLGRGGGGGATSPALSSPGFSYTSGWSSNVSPDSRGGSPPSPFGKRRRPAAAWSDSVGGAGNVPGVGLPTVVIHGCSSDGDSQSERIGKPSSPRRNPLSTLSRKISQNSSAPCSKSVTPRGDSAISSTATCSTSAEGRCASPNSSRSYASDLLGHGPRLAEPRAPGATSQRGSARGRQAQCGTAARVASPKSKSSYRPINGNAARGTSPPVKPSLASQQQNQNGLSYPARRKLLESYIKLVPPGGPKQPGAPLEEKKAPSTSAQPEEAPATPSEDTKTDKGKGKGPPKAPPPTPEAKGDGKGKGKVKGAPKPKPKPASNGKTKPLTWNRFDDVREDSVWSLNQESDNFKLEHEVIERLFATNNTSKSSKSEGPDEVVEPKKISLTSKARQMVISIGIHRLHKLGPEGIRAVIMTLDASELTVETTELLLSRDAKTHEPTVLPLPEELTAAELHIASGVGNQLLDDASQFIVAVCGIPHLQARLEFHLLRMCLDEAISNLRGTLNVLLRALEQVRHSTKLAKILILILDAGNVLNAGTMYGESRGFRMDSLHKLALLKGSDTTNEKTPGGLISLLDHLVDVIALHRPDLLQVNSELDMLAGASKTDLQEIQSGVNQLRADVLRLEKTLLPPDHGESSDAAGELDASDGCHDQGLQGAAEFFPRALESLADLDRELDGVGEVAQELMAYFGESGAKAPTCKVHEWLGYINSFVMDIQTTHAALCKKREQRNRRKRAQTLPARRPKSQDANRAAKDDSLLTVPFRRKRSNTWNARNSFSGQRRSLSASPQKLSQSTSRQSSPKSMNDSDGSSDDSMEGNVGFRGRRSRSRSDTLPQRTRKSTPAIFGSTMSNISENSFGHVSAMKKSLRKKWRRSFTISSGFTMSPTRSSSRSSRSASRTVSFAGKVEVGLLSSEDNEEATEAKKLARVVVVGCYTTLARQELEATSKVARVAVAYCYVTLAQQGQESIREIARGAVDAYSKISLRIKGYPNGTMSESIAGLFETPI